MDRFGAYLLIRRFLRRSESRNRALAVEAVMEELAAHATADPSTWGLLGLLSQLDLEYAAHNARTRGATSREQAELEGLDPALGAHLARWCQQPAPAEPAPVEDALVVASSVADLALGEPVDLEVEPFEEDGLEDEGLEQKDEPRPARTRGPSFPEELAGSIRRGLELRRGAGDPRGDRLDQALERLDLDGATAGSLGLRGLRRVEQDLR